MNVQTILKELFGAYTSAHIAETTVITYVRLLQDIPPDELRVVVDQCMVECKFLPTIAEIRERYTVLTKTIGQPTPEEAWENVMSEMRRIGSWGAPQFDDPITTRTVKAMDWLQLCRSENMIADRRQFIDMYKGLASRPQQVARLTPDARQLAERKAGLLPIGDIVKQLLDHAPESDEKAPF